MKMRGVSHQNNKIPKVTLKSKYGLQKVYSRYVKLANNLEKMPLNYYHFNKFNCK